MKANATQGEGVSESRLVAATLKFKRIYFREASPRRFGSQSFIQKQCVNNIK